MTTPSEAVERKVRQLDDVQAIYTMLVGIEVTQRRHDNRFEEIGSDVWQLKGDVSGLNTDAAALDAKLDRVLALLER